MKKTFTYKGTEVSNFNVKGEVYTCIPGKNYELDSQVPYVKTLVAKGILVEVITKTTPSPKPTTPKPADKKAEEVKPESSTTLEK